VTCPFVSDNCIIKEYLLFSTPCKRHPTVLLRAKTCSIPLFSTWWLLQVGNSSSQAGVTIGVQSPGSTIAATNTSIGWATAVTTDLAGNIYFTSSNSVFRVDPNGNLTRVAGKLQRGYSGDAGPATDAQLLTDDLVDETPAFGVPSGLAMDSKGNLYVSNGGNARVRKIYPDGIINTGRRRKY
jgi:hypothetical protein